HEDQRGTLYHYEVDGVRLLGHSTWTKWPGGANSFVVTDAAAEFPLPLTRGLPAHRWLLASGDIRSVRLFLEGEGWQRTPESATEQYQTALSDTHTGLGYAWANPAGLAGLHDVLPLENITLRFEAIPEAEAVAASRARDHLLYSLSFDPGLFWYRESRPVVALPGSLDLLIGAPQLAGSRQRQALADFSRLPDNLVLVHFAAGQGRGPGRVIPRPEWDRFLTVVPTERGPAWRVHCPPGRLDVTLPLPRREIDVMHEYPRIEFDCQLLSESPRPLFRLPVGLVVNGLRPRSLYLDTQQGGSLRRSQAEIQGADAGATFAYENVYAAGARWTRRTVLTREGALVVLDEYCAAASQATVSGGPVWQLAAEPVQHGGEFIARSFDRPDRRVRVWLHGTAGDVMGAPRLVKLLGEVTYAAYVRRPLAPGRTERFLSVLAPEELGPVTTTVAPAGEAVATIAGTTIRLAPDGTWSVTR
ncbi:MAG: hypothetical protein ACHQ5A_14285, partial [Opitutales bacterium]